MTGVWPAFWLLAELLWLPIKMVSLDTAGERSLIPTKGKVLLLNIQLWI